MIPYNPLWDADHLTRMHFDQYQRYRIAAEIITLLKEAHHSANEPWQILDVGGYFPTIDGILPVVSFLPDDTTLVIDTVAYDGANYQQASGTAIPFPNQHFDIVISCDTLEHVPADQRTTFLAELRRVARHAVIVAAPHNLSGVRQAEHVLNDQLLLLKQHNQMLTEHFVNGLPDPAHIDAWIAEQKIEAISFESGYLPRWQAMMLMKYQYIAANNAWESHARLDQTYNQHFFTRDQRTPGYRRVYVIAADGAVLPSSLTALQQRTHTHEPNDASTDLIELMIMPIFRAFGELGQHQQTLEVKLEQLITLLAHPVSHDEAITQLWQRLGVLEGEKRGLQQQLDMVQWQYSVLQAHHNSSLIGYLRRVWHKARNR